MQTAPILRLPQRAPPRAGAAAAVLGSTAFQYGGRDETGALSGQLLALNLGDPQAPWRQVGAAVGAPGPRIGHAVVAYAGQVWVVGGRGSDGRRLDDAWRFNPATLEWRKVGAVALNGPSRLAGGSGADGFELVALHGGFVIALGQLGQDENADPARKRAAVAAPHANGNAAASAHAGAARSTLLHALDLCGGTWRELPVSGHPGFDHAEALSVNPDGLLVALGWSAPRAGSKRDTPMQAAALKLGDALRGIGGGGGKADARTAVAWGQLQTRGHVPTARTGCASVLLEGEGGAGPRLIVTGGVMCSPAVKGVVTGDAFCLELDTGTWQRLPPAPLGAGSGAPSGGPRFAHCAVALPREHGGGALVIGGRCTAGEHASSCPLEVVRPTVAPSDAPAAQQAPTAAARRAAALSPPHDLGPYYLSDRLSDAEILVGSAPPLPAHRLVLAISPRFQELMEQAAASSKSFDSKEGRWKLHVADVYPEVLKLLLAYMYCRLDAVPPRDAASLFGAAARYGLPGLKAECLSVLCATTTLENVSTHVLLAHEEQSPELMQACVSYAAASKERFAQLLATPGYLHLTEASPRVAQAFLSQAMAELMRKG